MMNFDALFEKCSTLKVGVIGDVMLDAYMWGNTERISPEAPVPVVTVNKKEIRLGGAGNVAWNLVSMGADTFILSVVGNDTAGERLTELLKQSGIHTDYLLSSDARITTSKTRVISRNQQMMRLDEEQTADLSQKEADLFIAQVSSFIENERPDILIFEDYNKGVLTTSCIQRAIALCKSAGILTAADPKRKNFFTYAGVDLFKPNLKEVRDAFPSLEIKTDLQSLTNAHQSLFQKLTHRFSLITLSEKGIFYHDAQKGEIIPSHFRNIADVSGAGDTVISVAALFYRITSNIALAASVANIAGGLVCEEVGTIAIDRNKLLTACKQLIVV